MTTRSLSEHCCNMKADCTDGSYWKLGNGPVTALKIAREMEYAERASCSAAWASRAALRHLAIGSPSDVDSWFQAQNERQYVIVSKDCAKYFVSIAGINFNATNPS